MIKMEELVKDRDKQYPSEYTQEVQDNLNKLLIAINKVRTTYNIPMNVDSGWRPVAINSSTPGAATNSAHCQGLAVDIQDLDGSLWSWVLDNLQMMKDLGFFFEDRRWTPTWVHFGLRKPNSGKRIFIPSTSRATAPDNWDGIYDSKFDE